MASVDKLKVGDTTYDVSLNADGTLSGYVSNDNISPSAWIEADSISAEDINSSIFSKLTGMVRNIRWLHIKLGTEDFSSVGDTITEALDYLQTELNNKAPIHHTHTVSTLPVTNDTYANSTTLIPSSAAVYSLYTTMGDLRNKITDLEEKISLIGTIWIYEEDGTFEVPITGTYQVEMHGGGGGGAINHVDTSSFKSFAGGGGSGEIYNVNLIKGRVINVTIGAGGKGAKTGNGSTAIGGQGGTTTFGDLSLDGGFGGTAAKAEIYTKGGAASGSLASAGGYGVNNNTLTGYAKKGEGNTSNTEQTYGDGAGVSGSEIYTPESGQPGAVIITFMGRSTD